MAGVIALMAAVLAALVLTLAAAVRGAGRAARLRRAEAQVRRALSASPQAERARRLEDLARAAASAGPGEAAALVLACRRAFSREVIPILLAALGHPHGRVAEDARRALAGTGSPGLRAAWTALEAGDMPRAPLERFLLDHPDWLFERLLDAYVAFGAEAVRRHQHLWRQSDALRRLALMRTGSDAIGAIRAREIGRILGVEGDDRAA